MTKVVLEMDDELLAKLDELVQRTAKTRRPPRMMEWLTQTPEGQLYWANQRTKTYLSEVQMTAAVRAEWVKATGGAPIGRPKTMDGRLTIIRDALELYDKVHPVSPPTTKKVLPYPVKQRS